VLGLLYRGGKESIACFEFEGHVWSQAYLFFLPRLLCFFILTIIGPNNTLLIDDSHYKASMNPPHTAIHPTAWDDPDAHADDDALGPNGSIRAYLEALLLTEGSIPEFVRTTPFETFVSGRAAVKGLEEVLPPATPRSTTTPEQDYHQQQLSSQQHRYSSVNAEEDDDEEDEIVLAPAMAGLRMG
jgi:hypothetical protein